MNFVFMESDQPIGKEDRGGLFFCIGQRYTMVVMTIADETSSSLEWMDDILDELLSTSELHDCPYLPDRQIRSAGFCVSPGGMRSDVYQYLMNRGFRRSGSVFYRPVCPECRACVSIRVPVATFSPTRSMRRVWRRNRDVTFEIVPAEPSDEKYDLYARYLGEKHNGSMEGTREEFDRFLYDQALPAVECIYRLGQKMIGVSVLDRCPDALSSVYMYYDPDESKRSLGTFSILNEIEYCRLNGLPYYYLGYHVAEAPTMKYKADFQPAEFLHPDFVWRTEYPDVST